VGDEVRHAVNVFDAELRFVRAARLATAGALIGRVGCEGDVALLRELLGIQACDCSFTPPLGWATTIAGYFFFGS
jgi:hypothetical protein